MLARIRKSTEEKDQGFTLIELLVVMIIIGILAAIAIPVFLNQRTKAKVTAAKSDASVIGKEFASYYVDGLSTAKVTTNPGTPNKWTLTSADTTPYTTTGNLSGTDQANGTSLAGGTYCVTVTTSASPAVGDQYVVAASTGLTVATVTASGVPTCTPA